MLELLRQRRSIRQFQTRPVEEEKRMQLVEAALRSPTSRGRNPWEFILVDEPELLEKLAASKQHGSRFIAGAPLAIVVLADPDKSDVWIEDCSIAAIILQLAATSLGLASCWAQIRLRPHDGESSAAEYIRGLLGVPGNLQVECIIGVGYAAEEKDGHPEAALLREKVHCNRYPD